MKTLTQLTLATVVASAVSSGVNAVPVYGFVTDLQLTLGATDLMAHPNSVFNGLTIDGDTETGLTLWGDMIAYTAGTYVGLSWNLSNGVRQGPNGSGGTIFYDGGIEISTSTDGVNYTYFDTTDAGYYNTNFLAGNDGHIAPVPIQTTAGLVVDDTGFITVGGLWDLAFFGAGFNNAAGKIHIFGDTAAVFMKVYVPIPGAAWLFGSSLLGLIGMRRQRKSAI